jgi:hypothetical protein
MGSYLTLLYDDVVLALRSIRTYVSTVRHGIGHGAQSAKAHLKIVPLGLGPSIRTRFGDYVAPLAGPVYSVALKMALEATVDQTWCACIELVDVALTAFCNVPKVRILNNSTRDAFDFDGLQSNTIPVLLAPCDAFCKIGARPAEKSLMGCLATNSNLTEVFSRPVAAYVGL